MELAKYIPWVPGLAAVLCGLCCTSKALRGLAAWICIASIATAFGLSVAVSGHAHPNEGFVSSFFPWISIDDFHAGFSYFVDPLTVIMLFVVTGIGTLVAWYAAWYMKGDRGYARFFAAVSLFIFAMLNLVMADNLVLLYLGWEGVGLCSYLLIGYYYEKPSAVAAAKKAFIVNRIGDLGFALGIFLAFMTFETVHIPTLVERARAVGGPEHATLAMQVIPFLLMLGAFGKSAQIPLYVWLPDAMEGPTPVSALIHAATMVTAGVYMIARLVPLFLLSPAALPTVAVIGALTAIFAATIALCQYDIKRVFAYSTISQLGYMFLGVGVLSTVGGVFHLFTHAFFKALLFLTAGSVMHALAGQLDLRRMSGLKAKMPVTCWLMFFGCLALAGFPGLAGFFSKDTILADTFAAAHERHMPLFYLLGVLGLVTAFLTAYYTFRLWFRVFLGPVRYEMGHEHHGTDTGHESPDRPHDAEEQAAHEPGHAPAHAAADSGAHGHGAHHDAHEMPLLMNLPLIVLAVGAVAAGLIEELGFFGLVEPHWLRRMVEGSTAAVGVGAHGAEHAAAGGGGHHGPLVLGLNLHTFMMIVSSIVAIAGILTAWYFHAYRREAADRVADRLRGVVRTLANKYYVDELNDAAVVRPLRMLGEVFFLLDRMVIDGLVTGVGFLPRLLGMGVRPLQRGALQGYGLGMAFGAAVVLLLVFVGMNLFA